MSLYVHQIGKNEQIEQSTLVGPDQEKQELFHTAGRDKLIKNTMKSKLRKAEDVCPL